MAFSAQELMAGPMVSVPQGEWMVTRDARVTFVTVLGSCVAACVRDRVAQVGGMNHFLLAAPAGRRERVAPTARYGIFAMDQLIEAVLSAGTGDPDNLEFKVVGGGSIHPGMSDVGASNIAFMNAFLSQKGYAPLASDLGGAEARKVLYRPSDGKAYIRRLTHSASLDLVETEMALDRDSMQRRAAGTGR